MTAGKKVTPFMINSEKSLHVIWAKVDIDALLHLRGKSKLLIGIQRNIIWEPREYTASKV